MSEHDVWERWRLTWDRGRWLVAGRPATPSETRKIERELAAESALEQKRHAATRMGCGHTSDHFESGGTLAWYHGFCGICNAPIYNDDPRFPLRSE